MPEPNGSDWRARLDRLEESIRANWEDHTRLDRNIAAVNQSIKDQKDNLDQLLVALREWIDRIPLGLRAK